MAPSAEGDVLFPRREISLHVRRGPLRGEFFPTSGASAILIGRAPSNHVVVPDRHVSATHCLLVHTGQPKQFLLIDARSRLGTKVNGRPITRCTVSVGDVIAVGPVQFELIEAVSAQRPPYPVRPAANRPARLELVPLEGEDEGEILWPASAAIVGRSPLAHVTVPDRLVSGYHCLVTLDPHDDEQRPFVIDLHSGNGTYVNHRAVHRKHMRLSDILTVGHTQFILRRLEGAVLRPPEPEVEAPSPALRAPVATTEVLLPEGTRAAPGGPQPAPTPGPLAHEDLGATVIADASPSPAGVGSARAAAAAPHAMPAEQPEPAGLEAAPADRDSSTAAAPPSPAEPSAEDVIVAAPLPRPTIVDTEEARPPVSSRGPVLEEAPASEPAVGAWAEEPEPLAWTWDETFEPSLPAPPPEEPATRAAEAARLPGPAESSELAAALEASSPDAAPPEGTEAPRAAEAADAEWGEPIALGPPAPTPEGPPASAAPLPSAASPVREERADAEPVPPWEADEADGPPLPPLPEAEPAVEGEAVPAWQASPTVSEGQVEGGSMERLPLVAEEARADFPPGLVASAPSGRDPADGDLAISVADEALGEAVYADSPVALPVAPHVEAPEAVEPPAPQEAVPEPFLPDAPLAPDGEQALAAPLDEPPAAEAHDAMPPTAPADELPPAVWDLTFEPDLCEPPLPEAPHQPVVALPLPEPAAAHADEPPRPAEAPAPAEPPLEPVGADRLAAQSAEGTFAPPPAELLAPLWSHEAPLARAEMAPALRGLDAPAAAEACPPSLALVGSHAAEVAPGAELASDVGGQPWMPCPREPHVAAVADAACGPPESPAELQPISADVDRAELHCCQTPLTPALDWGFGDSGPAQPSPPIRDDRVLVSLAEPASPARLAARPPFPGPPELTRAEGSEAQPGLRGAETEPAVELPEPSTSHWDEALALESPEPPLARTPEQAWRSAPPLPVSAPEGGVPEAASAEPVAEHLPLQAFCPAPVLVERTEAPEPGWLEAASPMAPGDAHAWASTMDAIACALDETRALAAMLGTREAATSAHEGGGTQAATTPDAHAATQAGRSVPAATGRPGAPAIVEESQDSSVPGVSAEAAGSLAAPLPADVGAPTEAVPSRRAEVPASRWVAPAVGFAVFLAAATVALVVAARHVRPRYRAVVTVEVSPVRARLLGLTDEASPLTSYENVLRTQMELARSASVLAEAADRGVARELSLAANARDPAGALRDALEVRRVGETQLFSIALCGDEPWGLAAAANAIAAGYDKASREGARAARERELRRLLAERQALQQQARGAEAALAELLAPPPGPDAAVAPDSPEAIRVTQEALVELRSKVAAFAEKLARLRAALEADDIPVAEAAVGGVLERDAELKRLKTLAAQLRGQLVTAEGEAKEPSPDAVQQAVSSDPQVNALEQEIGRKERELAGLLGAGPGDASRDAAASRIRVVLDVLRRRVAEIKPDVRRRATAALRADAAARAKAVRAQLASLEHEAEGYRTRARRTVLERLREEARGELRREIRELETELAACEASGRALEAMLAKQQERRAEAEHRAAQRQALQDEAARARQALREVEQQIAELEALADAPAFVRLVSLATEPQRPEPYLARRIVLSTAGVAAAAALAFLAASLLRRRARARRAAHAEPAEGSG